MKNILLGIGLLQAVTISFRLLGAVSWPWAWVLVPLWAVLAFMLATAAIGIAMVFSYALWVYRAERRKKREKGGRP